MKQTFQEFIETWNGRYLETAGSPDALNQCTDLANAYIRDVLNLPIIEWTNAIDFPLKAGDKYDYILNTPTGVPSEGDLVIWGGNQYGHIAVFIEGDTNTFRSFDQNYPTGSPCHVQNHNYNTPQVLGWLHPKQSDQQIIIEQLRTERDNNWQLYQGQIEENKKLTARIAELEGQVNTLNDSKTRLQEDLVVVKNNLISCESSLQQLHQEDLNVVTESLDAQHKYDECAKRVGSLYSILEIPYDSDIEVELKRFVEKKKEFDKEYLKLIDIVLQFTAKRKAVLSIWQKIQKIWKKK